MSSARSIASRLRILGLIAVLTGAIVAGFSSSSAQAASAIGTVTVKPATGSYLSSIQLVTNVACPPGLWYTTDITGPGFPKAGQNVTGSTLAKAAIPPLTSYMVVPLQDTLQTFANLQTPPAPMKGTYKLTIHCHAKFSRVSLGDFIATVKFSGPMHYVALNPPVPSPTATARPSGSTAPSSSTTTQPTPSATANASSSSTAAPTPTASQSPATAPASASGASSSSLPWIFGGIALLLIAGGVWFIWRR